MGSINFDDKVCYSDSTYVLDKAIWDKYDMVNTKINVVKFIRDYKELKSMFLRSIVISESGLTSKIDNVATTAKRSSNGFADKVNTKLDIERDLQIKTSIFSKLISSFTDSERKYYDYCLQNNVSEEHLRDILGGLSKLGLLPIKNSCILKIALAFDIAILKNK